VSLAVDGLPDVFLGALNPARAADGHGHERLGFGSGAEQLGDLLVPSSSAFFAKPNIAGSPGTPGESFAKVLLGLGSATAMMKPPFDGNNLICQKYYR